MKAGRQRGSTKRSNGKSEAPSTTRLTSTNNSHHSVRPMFAHKRPVVDNAALTQKPLTVKSEERSDAVIQGSEVR
ncbi:hypothetical protein AGMMS49545_14670 [Betaproteobacteria bacterium]|nr:hypothetical protein AGMMS49545_14670 [Betaproteobacteria bacterium]